MIQFRPHHFLCTLGFQGEGYSPAFVKNYQKIAAQLNENPDTPIQVTQHLDSICQACPRQTSDKLCESQAFIAKLDHAHKNILGLQEQQVITWNAAKEAIKQRMRLEDFHAACSGCQWKSYGLCEAALKKLIDHS